MDNADAWLQYFRTLQAMLPTDEESRALVAAALDEYHGQLVAICISDRDQADRCKHFQRATDAIRERLEDLCDTER